MSDEKNGAPGTGVPNDSESSTNPKAQGAPWVNPAIQQRVAWRDGDIVVSVPMKSGTTWTMNIVHQLRSGGDPDLEDVYRCTAEFRNNFILCS
jgi:hypothetical protein